MRQQPRHDVDGQRIAGAGLQFGQAAQAGRGRGRVVEARRRDQRLQLPGLRREALEGGVEDGAARGLEADVLEDEGGLAAQRVHGDGGGIDRGLRARPGVRPDQAQVAAGLDQRDRAVGARGHAAGAGAGNVAVHRHQQQALASVELHRVGHDAGQAGRAFEDAVGGEHRHVVAGGHAQV